MSITYTAPSTPLAKITRDHDTQSRVRLDSDVVAEYAAAMAEGVQFPPVVVFNEGETFWLADGFHRVAAAEQAGKDVIAAEVRQGSKRDAILYSVGVNAQHGLRRSNGDKRRAVEVLLKDDEWRKWADREIARRAGVDHKTVGALRSELAARGLKPIPATRRRRRPTQTSKRRACWRCGWSPTSTAIHCWTGCTPATTRTIRKAGRTCLARAY